MLAERRQCNFIAKYRQGMAPHYKTNPSGAIKVVKSQISDKGARHIHESSSINSSISMKGLMCASELPLYTNLNHAVCTVYKNGTSCRLHSTILAIKLPMVLGSIKMKSISQ